MNMMQNVTKAVHDRVSSSNPRTVHINCGGALSAIDLNKDNSHVVVAGRTVFKVYAIEEDLFEEKSNLRVGNLKSSTSDAPRSHNDLDLCCVDVAWSHVEDHLLATASTNGKVIIWDLNKHSKSKQDIRFEDHSRAVNRVRFHENEPQLLLSGSQDGTMRIFDLRKRACSTLFKTASSIRDVQWCPPKFNDFFFASADESGSLQLWDMRRPDRAEKQITAHSGPMFSIDWHPEDKNWLATAGRDKMIKVWNVHSGHNMFSIQTIASVAKVRWRPQRKYCLASCSLVVDNSIYVWDIRRPYVPFASFEKHKDVTTGIVWRKDDPHVIYSSSRDQDLYQHVFIDAKRPASSLVPSGIDMNVNGSISLAIMEKPNKSAKSNQLGRFSFTKKDSGKVDEFLLVKDSKLYMFDNKEERCFMDWFVDCAKHYRLKGNLEEVCEHNAQLSEKHNKYEVAQCWRTLKALHSTCTTTSTSLHTHKTVSITASHKDTPDTGKSKARSASKVKDSSKDNEGEIVSGCSDEESDRDAERNLSSIARGQIKPPEEWDILFGGDPEQEITDDNNLDNMGQDWSLQYEAFQPRQEILENENALDTLQNGNESPTISANESENTGMTLSHQVKSNIEETVLSTYNNSQNLSDLNFFNSSMVAEMLFHFAEQGDAQTPVTMLIVLGPKLRPKIDEYVQENWFLSYLDLLARFQLWTISNTIIKLSHLPQIQMLNQQSTRIHVNCNTCNRPVQRIGWLCDRCKQLIDLCIICHLPAKGLFLWCQGCSHGGHIDHIEEWFSKNKQCPTGCGHFCEYT